MENETIEKEFEACKALLHSFSERIRDLEFAMGQVQKCLLHFRLMVIPVNPEEKGPKCPG